MKPSPLPWKVAQPWAGFSEIRDAEGKLVFGLAVGHSEERQPSDVCEANARLIERATAAFQSLVACVKEFIEHGESAASPDSETVARCRAALALAEKP